MELNQERLPIPVSLAYTAEKELMEGAAGAGSLVLEFSVLSRLTGDPRFEVS